MDDKVSEGNEGRIIGEGEYAIRQFLIAAGLKEWDKFEETAEAVADFWNDFLYTPDDGVPAKLLEPSDQLIVARNPFYSICSFNLFPFWGIVYVGYLGREGVLELTCVQENIKRLASEIITQEVLAGDISVWLIEALGHTDVAVTVVANHFNTKSGLEIQESMSSVTLGAFRNEPSVRQEFFSLCAICEE